MSAVRSPTVETTPTFATDVTALKKTHAEIDAVVAELVETLRDSWRVPHVPVNAEKYPGIYTVALDYPPLGAAGKRLFLATYHASPEAANKMNDPLRRYTLLTLIERQSAT